MSYSLAHYTQSWRGDLGPGKRPGDLARPDGGELIGTTDAANRLGIKPKTLVRLIREGKLPARMMGGRFYVTRGDVERRLAGEP